MAGRPALERKRTPSCEAGSPSRAPTAKRQSESRDLSGRDWLGVFVRAAKETVADNMPMIASALAYSTFMALPSILLVAVGLFTLLAGPDTVDELVDRLSTVMPAEASELLGDSLRQLEGRSSAGLVMTAVGLVVAVWAITSAMTTYMTATTIAFDRDESRGFVRKRVTALGMAAAISFAFLLVATLLVLGPTIEGQLGRALGMERELGYLWWSAQWPILVVGLLVAFAVLLWLGPDVEHREWRLVTLGSAVAVVVWLLVSGAFAVYTSTFASYNKTWGSLAAVIITLTWLWLSSLALLFAAEVNAEAARARGQLSAEPSEEAR